MNNILNVNLGNWRLDNPVIPASGTFGYEFSQWYDINILGSISLKTTTREPRFGNSTPRVAECVGGMLNSIGLQNPGIEKVISEEIPKFKKNFNKKIIASVGGNSIEDYVFVSKMFDSMEEVEILEINLSCPNVKNGGMSFGLDEKTVYHICEKIKNSCKKKIYIKLSPNVTDIVSIAKSAELSGADGLVLVNTLLGIAIDACSGKPIISNIFAGFSGPAIKPIALRMVYQVFKNVKIPIIGCGGIRNADDVIEFMSAGASAVQIGSANLVNPFSCKNIIDDLPKKMKKYGIQKIEEIIGRSHCI
ncbi:MAG: dihydroorotate dehydrogenase [Oscillospiraceae bacterium]|jgi:dihydroorotate dehydrogenase (NAD+) catalytic subunit|nr:dihydroorotate dehydrogenase [Oscillospiraceae bacterium]